MIQPIAPCLWFNQTAVEAANFYCSIFPDSEIVNIDHFTEVGPGPEGSVMYVEFRLNGQDFQAINGGPEFSFTEAISLSITCDDQEEVDYYWEKLSGGGKEVQCGWLQDKFGLSWQVVPKALNELLRDPDKARANNVMKAMLGMVKLDIAKLREAYDAEPAGTP